MFVFPAKSGAVQAELPPDFAIYIYPSDVFALYTINIILDNILYYK